MMEEIWSLLELLDFQEWMIEKIDRRYIQRANIPRSALRVVCTKVNQTSKTLKWLWQWYPGVQLGAYERDFV